MLEFCFSAALWVSSGQGAWHFVTVPVEFSEPLRAAAGPRTGFGAVPVTAQVGDAVWQTSVFPDAASGCFFLPVKRAVREANDVEDGDEITVTLTAAIA
jgi:hypothetical protein